MGAFFDTNVLLAAVITNEQRSTAAVRLVHEIDNGETSILNVIGLVEERGDHDDQADDGQDLEHRFGPEVVRRGSAVLFGAPMF